MLSEKVKTIKAFMKKNKITYDELSERSGIPVSTLNYIFTGRTENPRTDTMQAIERALGIGPSEVIPKPEMRPALAKVVEKCEELNDLGLYAVLGFIAALLKENPEQYRRQ